MDLILRKNSRLSMQEDDESQPTSLLLRSRCNSKSKPPPSQMASASPRLSGDTTPPQSIGYDSDPGSLPPPKMLLVDYVSGSGKPLTIPEPPVCQISRAVPGRPVNFGTVVPDLYRSSYPTPQNFEFLGSLGLKTIVTLVQRDEPDTPFLSFMEEHGIRHYVFDMKGTKKEDIPLKTMKEILSIVLDRRQYPLLVHCNHGRHRTGCVIAVARKLAGRSLDSVVDEYEAFAQPKNRECDVRYITNFDPADVSPLWGEHTTRHLNMRNISRTLAFSFAVMTIWLLSSLRMPIARDNGLR